ncbi:mRNA cleavage factor complex component [Grosmannia clavigera kw1407]|uniref:mRNA cleavage factor complex component n=1 Tax=Grosmannia clavigera (strain kw1407 / UAMH 11150) TaxID=655863 RepID=F0XTQ3_GROCL|nr:mRNA cleavage factor complex component [Grosmannia clavigera kw1407]EFW98830.1 mRNA cleavage factor complex component [Grosmannia clavigera kw1407]
MSYEDHSEDVAADFRDALEGLTMNSRVEITTLTVIARENTEYAHAISEVLQEHIKKASYRLPLPASTARARQLTGVVSRGLYTTFMDAYASVDNGTRRKMDEMLKTWKEPVPGSVDPRPVFSPETVRPIESALMKAKASAFQAQQEHLRSEQQLLGRGRPHNSGMPYRETPTPPGGRPGYPPQNPYPQQTMLPGSASSQMPVPQQHQAYPIHPAHATTQSTPQPPSTAPTAGPFQPPPTSQIPFSAIGSASRMSIESLNEDVGRLILATKAEFAEKPYDASVAARLKALLDLQMILKSQNLEYDKLLLVKNQIDALSVNLPSHLKAQYIPTATPPAGYPPYQPPASSSAASAAPTLSGLSQIQLPPGIAAAAAAALAAAHAQGAAPAATGALPPASGTAGSVSIDRLLGKGALAAILAARQQQTAAAAPAPAPVPAPAPTPVPALQTQSLPLALSQALSQMLPQQHQPAGFSGVAPGGNAGNPLALMDMLRKAGILQGQQGAQHAQMGGSMPATLSSSLASILASARAPALGAPTLGARVPLQEIRNEISFQSASLKHFRPHLLPLLYEKLGPPCTQCGRRFQTDGAGRAAKTAHMDWHFRVHQRIVESEKRGQHRSWYVDQADWIQSREAPPEADGVDHGADGIRGSSGAAGANGRSSSHQGAGSSLSGTGGAGAGGGKVQWIPVPSDGAGANQACPICQERFKMQWLDEAQEWVWIDAVQIGSRVYHASCHAEATKSGAIRDHPAASAMAAMLSGVLPPQQLPQQPMIPTEIKVAHSSHHRYRVAEEAKAAAADEKRSAVLEAVVVVVVVAVVVAREGRQIWTESIRILAAVAEMGCAMAVAVATGRMDLVAAAPILVAMTSWWT